MTPDRNEMSERTNHPIGCFDANEWAKELNDYLASCGEQPIDHDLMRAWFANSIMTGYDEGARKQDARIKELEGQVENLKLDFDLAKAGIDPEQAGKYGAKLAEHLFERETLKQQLAEKEAEITEMQIQHSKGHYTPAHEADRKRLKAELQTARAEKEAYREVAIREVRGIRLHFEEKHGVPIFVVADVDAEAQRILRDKRMSGEQNRGEA